jgi:hypothetical protein
MTAEQRWHWEAHKQDIKNDDVTIQIDVNPKAPVEIMNLKGGFIDEIMVCDIVNFKSNIFTPPKPNAQHQISLSADVLWPVHR